MIISNDKKYYKAPFTNEDEIESVVIANFEYLFGPSSIYLSKMKIQTADGVGTIPDGFAIDIENKKWYIVEAELGCHSVWTHIAPQITKQILASIQPKAKEKILEVAVKNYNEDQEVRDKFAENGIREIDVRKILSDILKQEPIIGIPIDVTNEDLKDWSNTQRFVVKLWNISKYVDFKDSNNIMYEFPEEYRADFESVLNQDESIGDSGTNLSRSSEITIKSLIEAGMLNVGDELIHEYGQKGKDKKKYIAMIKDDGSLSVLNQTFYSPSMAAIACINDYGSNRKTVNGWTSWRRKDGVVIDDLRYKLKNKNIG